MTTALIDAIAGPLDREGPVSLTRQLYEALRAAILEGRLAPGARLPASRILAGQLDLGRNTVIAVFERLAADGFIEAHGAAGTVVARIDPALLLRHRAQKPATGTLSLRGAALAAIDRGSADKTGPFVPGLPALDLFPGGLWARLVARRLRQSSAALLGFGHAQGWPPLREAIARHLADSRGIVADPETVVITTGAQGALDFVARLLCDVGDPVWIEDPGYLGARGAFTAAGLRLVPVPVDDEGLRVDEGTVQEARPRLIYVTPSHQYPTGVAMSLPRRLALLAAAQAAGAWVIEDDYDSEFRFDGPPPAPLHNLDAGGRIIYIGTLGKALAPALRVGFALLPPPLAAQAAIALRHTGQSPPPLIQATLADFIADGHFAAHLRKLKPVYAERRAALIEACGRSLGGLGSIMRAEAGIQVALRLHRLDDRAAAAAAAAAGIIAPALSRAAIGPAAPSGLQLGFAAVDVAAIKAGVARLAGVLHDLEARAKRPG
jgi:GntR family transcriptional regulator/MocR family aminotransferase